MASTQKGRPGTVYGGVYIMSLRSCDSYMDQDVLKLGRESQLVSGPWCCNLIIYPFN